MIIAMLVIKFGIILLYNEDSLSYFVVLKLNIVFYIIYHYWDSPK